MSDRPPQGKRPEGPQLPPPPPAQSAGPHVELNAEGVIVRAPPEALDRQGNHLTRLRSLHPELRDLARELYAALQRGNRPYTALDERAAAYAALIDQELTAVDFGRLYVAGVRLENANHETQRHIAAGELPPMDPSLGEKLASAIALHGVFILGTADGVASKHDEERYQRVPEEERQYRAAAMAVAEKLQDRPDIIERDVARDVLNTTTEIGAGRNPERSTVAGHATLRNVVISLAAGAAGSAILSNSTLLLAAGGGIAAWFGGLAISDSLRKSQFYKKLTDQGGSVIDAVAGAAGEQTAKAFKVGLDRHAEFVTKNEPMLRRLTGWFGDMKFLDGMLDWLRAHRAAPKPQGATVPEGNAAFRIFGSRMVVELSLGQLANYLRAIVESSDGATLPVQQIDEHLQFPPGGAEALLALHVPLDGVVVEVLGGHASLSRAP